MSFFRKSGVKAACAILCIVCLTAALVSGAGVLTLLWNNASSTGGLLSRLAGPMLREDMDNVMYNYFDPADPTHPWVSYYSGAIYSGQGSNFVYRITDEDGNVVLASYTGSPAVSASRERVYSFDLAEEVREVASAREEGVPEVESPIFLCTGRIFVYDREGNYFRPVEDETAEYLAELDDIEELSAEALYVGFYYQDYRFEYDIGGFYAAYNLEEFTYAYTVKDFTITGYVLADMSSRDSYWRLYLLASLLMRWRDAMTAVFLGSLVLGLGLLILLCCVVDHVNGQEGLALNPIYRIPTDVALGIVLLLAVLPLHWLARLYRYFTLSDLIVYLAGGVLLTGLVTLAVYAIVMLFARGKKGILLTGTLLYWLWKNLGRGLRALGRGLLRAASYLPLLWKVGLCYLAICLIEFLILVYDSAYGGVVLLWFIGRLIGAVLVGYVALAFRRLKTGAETIAAGDYNTKVDEKYLLLDFKDTAETLNHIRDGMTAAVDSRMRSERMKTELITNVSHDLKTPLTSIVSYVDLLKQELGHTQAVSNQAEEYLEVLDRQSMRLKKLIEDLVEASKASTGNLNLQLEPLDFGMLLGQALGEYGPRLAEANLTLMTQLPERPVMVQADGRRLWRVFDNLLSNAVKYAMPGTRLYLNVETDGNAVTAVFRNISREPLETAPEELMERFVRGDESRHTEGSGLGLSIARSLTESMGGTLRLALDGDLFKAMVTFPVLRALEQETQAPD